MTWQMHIRVLRLVEDMLKPAQWEIPEDFLTREHCARVIRELNWNSSPGYPYLQNHANNRSLFRVDIDGNPSESMVEWAWQAVQVRLKDREADPIRLFVKPEPISIKKSEAGRYRLISSVSVIDQIIDTMLFGEFCDKLVEKCHETPIKTGWTPIMGGWKEVPRIGVVSTDKSSWDWTVNIWLLDCLLEIINKLCRNPTEQWCELAKWRFRKLFREAVFVTSGGRILAQKYPGVMKSGCKITIAGNSVMQLILHARVAFEIDEPMGFIWAMGDDVIQYRQSKKFFQTLEQYCILKEVTPLVEFAGYRYSGMRVEPLYRGKHAFMLLHQEEQYHKETADAYALLYHRSDWKRGIRDILTCISDDLIDEDTLTILWDSE